jgi:hypothetical protein
MTMNDNPPVSRPERDAGGRQRSLRERDTYYILVRTPHVDEQKHVLKHGETFGVFDHYGDIMPIGLGEHGLFHEGTRYLSTFVLRLARTPMCIRTDVSRSLAEHSTLPVPDSFTMESATNESGCGILAWYRSHSHSRWSSPLTLPTFLKCAG